MEIVWSRSSLVRLEEIGKFIAMDSPERAGNFIDTLIHTVERLRDFPYSGALVLDNPAFRQVVVRGYRIIYRINDTTVEIVTVLSPGLSGAK